MALVGEKRLLSRCFEETHPTCTAQLRCSPVKRQRTIAATSGGVGSGIGSGSDLASLLVEAAGERGAEVAIVLRRQVQILSQLLPGMENQRIEEELVTANGDLMLALERLGQLQLSNGGGASANESASGNERDDPSAAQHHHHHQQRQQDSLSSLPSSSSSSANVRKLAQVLVDELGSVKLQRNQVVDVVEQYMHRLLEYHDKETQQEAIEANGHDPELVRRTVNENSVLKRAVQIQSNRIHALENQVHALSAQVQREAEERHLAEKARHDVEKKNYLLQAHLQAAMPSGGMHFPDNGSNGPPPPDVF